MKKTLSLFLSVLMLISVFSVMSINAEEIQSGAPTAFKTVKALYAHAVSDSADNDAWQEWQSIHDEDYYEANTKEKYFFLPSSADSEKVDIYNAFSEVVTVNGTEIAPEKTESVSYSENVSYEVKAENTTYKLKFMKSGAEAAIYVNNSNADGNGTDLMSYLNVDKSRDAKATGAIVTPDGKVDNTKIKKIKGRGNTTWMKAKKAYNITYDEKVSIAGMKSSKKYSILANYQDDSLSRNRFLYDLSDAVGMPYASDSRYVDFYVNGYYWGSYQMTEKVEAGKNYVVNDFEEEDYLNEDGTVKEDFPFLCEVDAGATKGEDFFVSISSGVKLTIKSPELGEGDKGYNEVSSYVKQKFTEFYNAARTRTADLSPYADVDSLAKLYLVNELGKNWDAGVSSLFFTYRQDENGKFKFYGSPVWDFDNSLGNAVGVSNELRSMGVTDYEEYTGWWCKKKGLSGSSKTSSNIMNRFAQNTPITKRAAEIWFEKFVPAIDHFAGVKFSEEINSELYTADEYYKLIEKSAAMNYTSGWLLNTGSWIADHSSLKTATYDGSKKIYAVNKNATKYKNDFKGMYDYCRDWMISRAAWLSKEMSSESVTEKTVDNKTEGSSSGTAKISASSVSLKAGATKTLKVTNGIVKSWKSSKASVAKVKNGKVTALKKGTANITATLSTGKTLKCKVKVTSSPTIKVGGKKFKKSKTYSLNKGKKLKIKITGKASSVKNVYKSSKKKVAKVVSKTSAKAVKIKGVKKGKAKITLKVNGVSFKIKVKVK
ncbi:MAG: CotH kinase family protein [Ruminococcus sp.]|nr:CotH kinase family protein [Ruminococcus sp.]